MLFMNYASNTGFWSTLTVADVSHKYDTLFAPAGYAFTIWGVIFLGLICFVSFQWFSLRKGDPNNYIRRIGLWLAISNLANAAWVYCWLNESLGWSVIIILLLLLSLIMLTLTLRLELDDVPVREIFFVWWPIAIYFGWIIVATVACIAAWLTSISWSGWNINQPTWAIILIIAGGIVFSLLVIRRNLREAAAVGMWAFIAIGVRQHSDHPGIALTAFGVSAILLSVTAWHAYQNRQYNIFKKLQRGEWA